MYVYIYIYIEILHPSYTLLFATRQVLIAKAFRLVRRQRIALGLLLFEWRMKRRVVSAAGVPWDFQRCWARNPAF